MKLRLQLLDIGDHITGVFKVSGGKLLVRHVSGTVAPKSQNMCHSGGFQRVQHFPEHLLFAAHTGEFPPKKDGDFETAFATLDKLGALHPAFISVTYGAGGSNCGKTVDIASYIQNQVKLPALAHLTCVGSKKEMLREVLDALKAAGVTKGLISCWPMLAA